MTPSRKTAVLLLLGSMTLGSGGCRKRVVQTSPPAIIPAPPVETAPQTNSEAKPDTPAEATPTPAPPPVIKVPPPRPAPVRPRSTPPEAAAPKTAPAPQISPGLSAEEQALAQRRTNQDIAAAERNLQVAYGKQLNAAQSDLVEKIRGFLAQAHEAIRASDWVRARNLAQKAHLLSVELINSL